MYVCVCECDNWLYGAHVSIIPVNIRTSRCGNLVSIPQYCIPTYGHIHTYTQQYTWSDTHTDTRRHIKIDTHTQKNTHTLTHTHKKTDGDHYRQELGIGMQ